MHLFVEWMCVDVDTADQVVAKESLLLIKIVLENEKRADNLFDLFLLNCLLLKHTMKIPCDHSIQNVFVASYHKLELKIHQLHMCVYNYLSVMRNGYHLNSFAVIFTQFITKFPYQRRFFQVTTCHLFKLWRNFKLNRLRGLFKFSLDPCSSNKNGLFRDSLYS